MSGVDPCRHPDEEWQAALASPLSEQMRALLRAQPRREGTDLVFPGERGVFSGWSKSKARLDQGIAARLRKNAEEQGIDQSDVTIAGLDLARSAPHRGHRLAEARRPARSDRGHPQPRCGKPRRDCRRLPATITGPTRSAPRWRPGARMSPRSSKDREADDNVVPLQAQSR